jgi:hypothetical protein
MTTVFTIGRWASADWLGKEEFVAIHESDGAPVKKERRPKHQSPGYQACMMAQ